MAKLEPRGRKVKILATLGPASNNAAMLRRLFTAGADAFRINLSHGDHKTHAREVIHGMAMDEWKDRFQTEATPEQIARMDASVALNQGT